MLLDIGIQSAGLEKNVRGCQARLISGGDEGLGGCLPEQGVHEVNVSSTTDHVQKQELHCGVSHMARLFIGLIGLT